MSENFKKTDEAKYPKTEVVFVPFKRRIPDTSKFEHIQKILANEIKARNNMRVVQIHNWASEINNRASGVFSAERPRGLIVIFEEITTEMQDIESHIKSNSVRLEKKIDSLKTELASIKETIKNIYQYMVQ